MTAVLNHPFVKGLQARLIDYEKELKLDQYHALNFVHTKSSGKIPRIYAVLATVLIGFSLMTHFVGLSFVSHLIGFYPVYWSFKALKTSEKDDDVQWLTYWVVYGFLSTVESVIDRAFFWLPLYFLAKIVFLIWCFHPATRGALVVYQRAVLPIFTKLENDFQFSGSRPSSISTTSAGCGSGAPSPSAATSGSAKQRTAARHVD